MSEFAARFSIVVCDILDKSKFCEEHNATQTTIENLAANSDIISLHVPLTSITSEMVDKNFIDQMQTIAYLVNTSRGGVVNQSDLKIALKRNNIAGAALDVFAEEPPSDEEFLLLPNLMVSPHIGGNAKEAVEAMGHSAIDHLVSFF
jgi:D-3-phosphoglycerate dehydrogenase